LLATGSENQILNEHKLIFRKVIEVTHLGPGLLYGKQYKLICFEKLQNLFDLRQIRNNMIFMTTHSSTQINFHPACIYDWS